jgi:hypothetical protein
VLQYSKGKKDFHLLCYLRFLRLMLTIFTPAAGVWPLYAVPRLLLARRERQVEGSSREEDSGRNEEDQPPTFDRLLRTVFTKTSEIT